MKRFKLVFISICIMAFVSTTTLANFNTASTTTDADSLSTTSTIVPFSTPPGYDDDIK